MVALRAECERRNLDSAGLKAVLVARLREAMEGEGGEGNGDGDRDGDGLAGAATSEPKSAPPLHPGRRGLTRGGPNAWQGSRVVAASGCTG